MKSKTGYHFFFYWDLTIHLKSDILNLKLLNNFVIIYV